eukprot:9496755-Pyramimonas_sp.AAC.1
MRDKDARALDAHLEAFRAGRFQQKRRRMDRGGKDARVPLGMLPILTMRVDCRARRLPGPGTRSHASA